MGAIPSIELEPNSTYTITITKTCAEESPDVDTDSQYAEDELTSQDAEDESEPEPQGTAPAPQRSTRNLFVPLSVDRPASLERPLLNIDTFAPILEVGNTLWGERDSNVVYEGNITCKTNEVRDDEIRSAARDRELKTVDLEHKRVLASFESELQSREDHPDFWVILDETNNNRHNPPPADVDEIEISVAAATEISFIAKLADPCPEDSRAIERKFEREAESKYRCEMNGRNKTAEELDVDYHQHSDALSDKDLENKIKEFKSRYRNDAPPRTRSRLMSRGKIIEFDDYELAAELGMGYTLD